MPPSINALFILGNTRRETFVNAILAADQRSRSKGRGGLTDVVVIHSKESEKALGVYASQCAQ